jgi:hypothetical protein
MEPPLNELGNEVWCEAIHILIEETSVKESEST